MEHEQYVEIRQAAKKVFVHFTYAWHEKNIEKGGLNSSVDGLMGKAIYCCDIEDDAAMNKAIDFMKDEINWRALAEHLGLEDPDEIEDDFNLDQILVPVYFLYSGSYMYGLQGHPMDIEGYVAIQAENIPAKFLDFGRCLEDRDIDTQIEGINPDVDFDEAFAA